MILGFKGPAAEALLREVRGDHPIVSLSPALEAIQRLLNWLPASGSQRKLIDGRSSAQLIWDILSAIAQANTSPNSNQQALVYEAMNHMLNNISTITLEQLVSELGTNRMQLNRCFQEQLELSPGKWLRQQRLMHAQDLLRDPDLSLDQIAIRTGYSNATALTAAFKNEYQMTPTQWKLTQYA